MENDFNEFIERVKGKVDITDVVEKCGFSLRKDGGGNYRATSPKSLVICPQHSNYFHYGDEGSKGWTGDHITFVQTYGDRPVFMEALRFVADLAGEAMPEFSNRGASPAAVAFRERTELWDIVGNWLGKQLWANAAAVAYARGRGWTDETIHKARLGFTGATPELKEDLRGEMRMYEHDPLAPAAVAVLGLEAIRGVDGIRDWCKKYDVNFDELPESAKKGRIWGLLDFPRLVYPHVERGRIVYFSARNLKWGGGAGEGVLIADKDYKSWNLPKVLVGERPRYFNHLYHPSADEVVIAEGPADGITWGQWGVACECLVSAGMGADVEEHLQNVKRVFAGTDNGETGRKAIGRIGDGIGPLVRVLTFPVDQENGEDANDWLQDMLKSELVPALEPTKKNNENASVKAQREQARKLMDNSEPYVLYLTQGLESLSLLRQEYILGKIVKLSERLGEEYDFYRKDIGDATGKGVQWLDRQIKKIRQKEELERKEEDEKESLDIVEFIGQKIHEQRPDGSVGTWMVEIVFDRETNTPGFAYRDPDGVIGEAKSLTIGNVEYIPPIEAMDLYAEMEPEECTIVVPGKLGEEKETVELVDDIYSFLKRYFFWTDMKWCRLSAYYVLLTWVYDAFSIVPYLRALGDYGSGKTQLIWRIGYLCYRLIKTGGATTVSPIFRILDEWGGTLFLDEVDTKNKETYNDFMTILLTGFQRGIPVLRSSEGGGKKGYKQETFKVYGPKLISSRKRFLDKALESRCLTHETVSVDEIELSEFGIPSILPPVFYEEAEEIRNRLLTWRLRTWKKHIFTDKDFVKGVTLRLQQVTAGLMKLADDPKVKADVEELLQNFMKYEVAERAMTTEARTLEAIIDISTDENLRNEYKERQWIDLSEGSPRVMKPNHEAAIYDEDGSVIGLYFGSIVWRANILMNEQIALDGGKSGNSPKKNDNELSGKKIGHVVRTFGFVVDGRHRTYGTYMLLNKDRLHGLRLRYGL
ncbi:MAG: hypothetical protein HN413_08105 [Chloroflexi bacterium]|jgi:hypothetical protein|nr:hypothetical protein [Chloroflexota bacterium]